MPVPVTSVVIPAYRAWETLPLVLDALFHQVAGRNDREVIVVESSADGRARAVAGRWPWARLIILDRRASVGEARNIGVRHARGSLLAFLDADAVPSSNWLDELEQALTPEMEMVGGAILNGRPRSPVSAAAHILELLEWTPPRPDPLLHAAGGNLLVSREAFEAA
jgi:glycosyltransferase involved in cell wall biosynthesis